MTVHPFPRDLPHGGWPTRFKTEERMPDQRNANARLDGHEILCTERWGQVRQQLKAIWWLLAVSAGTVITAQGAIILKLWK